MLIDFTVENYRSINDVVTLSMVAQSPVTEARNGGASSRETKSDEAIAPTTPVPGRKLSLLPVVGIFGANASGKSNVLHALNFVLDFMRFGDIGRDVASQKYLAPYRLSQEMEDKATKFELRVSLEKGIFTYRIEILHRNISNEHLEYIPIESKRMVPRLLFDRSWDSSTKTTTWKNGEDFRRTFTQLQSVLNSDIPFLSLIMWQLNVPLLTEFAMWLRYIRLGKIDDSDDLNLAVLRLQMVGDLSASLKYVTEIIRRFDTGITDIQIERSGGEYDPQQSDQNKIWVLHESEQGRIRWEMWEESAGTQRLFGLASKIYVTLHWGSLVLIDELDASLHPNITRAIVRLFQSEKTNPKRAQLIFTSHDNTLKRAGLLRRDQIWFTQKRPEGSTELYPLTDFHPRKDLALDKAYLDGRFGAVPLLPDDVEDLIDMDFAPASLEQK